MKQKICDHIAGLEKLLQPKNYECAECVKHGGEWVHLRTCQTCGITLCCDDSPATHMTRHFEETGHPVIISAEPGERWIWCYKDEQVVSY
jgi:hypothetical protein